jgi:hypothetical protein
MSYLDHLPTPAEIHDHLRQLKREMTLLRRLLRLSQAAAANRSVDSADVAATVASLKSVRQLRRGEGQ